MAEPAHLVHCRRRPAGGAGQATRRVPVGGIRARRFLPPSEPPGPMRAGGRGQRGRAAPIPLHPRESIFCLLRRVVFKFLQSSRERWVGRERKAGGRGSRVSVTRAASPHPPSPHPSRDPRIPAPSPSTQARRGTIPRHQLSVPFATELTKLDPCWGLSSFNPDPRRRLPQPPRGQSGRLPTGPHLQNYRRLPALPCLPSCDSQRRGLCRDQF